MKLQLIIEILVLCALVAFATARVIDSRNFDDGPEFTARLISNVTKNNNKHRQNEIVVSAADYDDPVGSHEISVGEEDLVASQNNVVSNDIPSAAASGVVTSNEDNNVALLEDENTEVPVNIDDAHPLNRYCTCTEAECNCCREFKLPLVSVRGPGCASLRYLGKNRMSIAIKYGDITLTSRTISGRKARPVCLNLPGGFSQFCGRIYGINRESDDFQACLGLELRAEEEVEAALRVSCFKFGPRGLKMTDAQPLPPVVEAVDEDDEEGGGLLGLVTGAGDSDEDYDEDEEDEDEAEGQDVGSSTSGDEDTDLLGFADDDEEDEDDDESDEDADELDDEEDDDSVAPPDYPTGFSLLDGIFGDAPNKKKKPIQTRNKVNTVAEDVKVNQVGAKVKIPNSPAILSSASLSQNEIDTTIPKESASTGIKLDPVELAPAAETVVAEVVAAAATTTVEKPKPVESSVITELQSNAGVPLVSTTPKPKKKPASLLDTLESLISGGDDDDDDEEDDDDDATKDDETEDDDEEEETDDDDEKDDDEEKEDDDEKDEEKDEDEEKEEDEEKDEEEDEEDEPEDDDEDEKDDDAEESTNDKETLTTKGDEKDTKKKKKGAFSGFFARLMKFI